MDPRYLSELAAEMATPVTGVDIRDRRFLLKVYEKCFIGGNLSNNTHLLTLQLYSMTLPLPNI